MKKKLISILYAIIALSLSVFCYYIISGHYHNKLEARSSTSQKSPFHLLQNGPYGRNVAIAMDEGNCRYKIEAEKLYLKKTKFGVFNNALLKKIVAENLTLTVFNKDQLCLKVTKDRSEFSVGMKKISITGPHVNYPEKMKNVRKLEIDKDNGTITFFSLKDKKEIWDLRKL